MNPSLRAHARQQARQCVFFQSHAAGGGRETLACQMHEDRTASPGDARARVVVDFDDQVVEVIAAPEPVAGLVRAAPEWPVIAAVAGVLAPGIVLPDGPDRQSGVWPRRAVGPPPQPAQSEQPARRPTVALALVGP